jgi:hypothetical protein
LEEKRKKISRKITKHRRAVLVSLDESMHRQVRASSFPVALDGARIFVVDFLATRFIETAKLCAALSSLRDLRKRTDVWVLA